MWVVLLNVEKEKKSIPKKSNGDREREREREICIAEGSLSKKILA